MQTASNLEKAQVIFKLARKGNWGAKYDRLEHFKRFQNLDTIIKDLSRSGWLLTYKKQHYLGISLNPENKRAIIDFVEKELPHLKGSIW